MSQFLDPLTVTEISDSVFAIADHPFRYESDIAKQTLIVPIGFYTDFASVPRLGIVYSLLGDRAHEPAVIHDWLYYSALISRDMADNVLFEAMGVLGLPWWQKWPIYMGVRIGGWKAWNDHRKAGHPEAGKFSTSPNIVQKSL